MQLERRGMLAIICLATLPGRRLDEPHSHAFAKAVSFLTFPECSCGLLILPLLWTLQTISHRCYVKPVLHLTTSCWPQSLCPLQSWPWKPGPTAGFASLINPKPGSSQFRQLFSIWAACEWWSNNATSVATHLSVFTQQRKEDDVPLCQKKYCDFRNVGIFFPLIEVLQIFSIAFS